MKIKSGPFKGKEIELASVGRVDAMREVADDFMFEIFDFDAGEYLITDESSLTDFTEYGSSNLEPIWMLVQARYGVGPTDVRSDNLIDIFEAIIARRNPN